MRKTKIFYPWNLDQIDYWIEQNNTKIKVIGQLVQDYVPRGKKQAKGKQTIIFYEEKK